MWEVSNLCLHIFSLHYTALIVSIMIFNLAYLPVASEECSIGISGIIRVSSQNKEQVISFREWPITSSHPQHEQNDEMW